MTAANERRQCWIQCQINRYVLRTETTGAGDTEERWRIEGRWRRDGGEKEVRWRRDGCETSGDERWRKEGEEMEGRGVVRKTSERTRGLSQALEDDGTPVGREGISSC